MNHFAPPTYYELKLHPWRWGGARMQYFRCDWVGTLMLFSSYRPETTITTDPKRQYEQEITKYPRLFEHCSRYKALGWENVYFLSGVSMSAKASSSFSVMCMWWCDAVGSLGLFFICHPLCAMPLGWQGCGLLKTPSNPHLTPGSGVSWRSGHVKETFFFCFC